MNKKNWMMLGAVALAFGVTGALVGTRQKAAAPPAATPAPQPGSTQAAAPPSSAPLAPGAGPVESLYAQALNDVAGKPQSLSQWKGKALVVNFWAPWCAPCVKEMPELAAFATDSAAKGVSVIGIGIDSPSNIAQFADKYRISYPLYVAGMSGTELSRQFGNQGGGLPFTVLLSSGGRVVKTYLGKLKMDELRRDISAL